MTVYFVGFVNTFQLAEGSLTFPVYANNNNNNNNWVQNTGTNMCQNQQKQLKGEGHLIVESTSMNGQNCS